MDKLLTALVPLVALAIIFLVGWDAIMALVVVALLSWIVISVFRVYAEEKDFVTQVFIGALLARLLFGLLVHLFDLRAFFGGDATTYDERGTELFEYWQQTQNVGSSPLEGQRSNWGMQYFVALLYSVFGRNIFLAQSVVAVFGAATSGLVYFCSRELFQNRRVSRLSALLVAFFPSFILWSGQLLKDGLVIFLIVLSILTVLELQKRFNYLALGLLIVSLFGILALRFYVFYMVAVSVVGSFIVGISKTNQGIIQRLAAIVIVGLGLTYFGVLGMVEENVESYGTLERVQVSRASLARTAGSGFGEETDVSTTEGAISAIPIGLAYLMLAPFPWEVSSLRSAITTPEVLVWWAMIPVVLMGAVYTLRSRLRTALPIVIFSIMLTLAYSIFQGNVGTAYRQRTQIQVFLFIFFAVGWVLIKERRENKQISFARKLPNRAQYEVEAGQ
jgi:4-amino-4-deoxy-L-arabinose transferase-like glycosyltransferase